ncbi:MAG TPA: hypothetical protein VI094_01815 [Propionibacteriaceae bacterium]
MKSSQSPVLIDQLSSLELNASQPIIYDRPIGVRLLYQDPVSLTANQQLMGPLSYCHFPAGTVMHHAPEGDRGCLFVIIFDGPYDVTPAVGP